MEIIGEAAGDLSNDVTENSPETPWKDWIDQRIVLSHFYPDIDLIQVWQTVSRDIPMLEAQVEALLDEPWHF